MARKRWVAHGLYSLFKDHGPYLVLQDKPGIGRGWGPKRRGASRKSRGSVCPQQTKPRPHQPQSPACGASLPPLAHHVDSDVDIWAVNKWKFPEGNH